jgi:fructose-1,6-bisphosphatase I
LRRNLPRMNVRQLTTLNQFLVEAERRTEGATGDFTRLFSDLMLACRIINFEVNRAGLADILGEAGNVNVQGEDQKKLDVISNEQVLRVLRMGGQTCALGSEEEDEMIVLNSQDGKYVVLTDPLDGSSNIDVNVPIGTIFSIYKRVSPLGSAPTIEDCLQPGSQQVAAGYVMYGSSTVLVFTTGDGVNGFTHDPSLGEFFLSHPNLQIPEKAAYYSINDSNRTQLSEGLQGYLQELNARISAGEKLSPRYVGSLVADFHRNLLKGGIFIYPGSPKAPKGKLRLLYEANPMAFIIEQAGGIATDGTQRILDLKPTELHQRCPLFIGSKGEVERAMAHLATEVAVAH